MKFQWKKFHNIVERIGKFYINKKVLFHFISRVGVSENGGGVT